MEQIIDEKSKLEVQRRNVASLYDEVASVYDEEFEGRAEYQVPRILMEMYSKYGIKSGKVLDIGCGTGKLKDYLGKNFEYEGIDISAKMLEEAKKRGFGVYFGPVEDVIRDLEDKSVDHVVALSSLYFVRDFQELVREMMRVARKSIFISLEQFEPKLVEIMKKRDIEIYNHSASFVPSPTEVIRNLFLWKSPSNLNRVFGDIVFKKF